MKKAADEVSGVVHVFLMICVTFGGMAGFIGLGVGLLCLSVPQAFGVALLASGAGSLWAATIAGKRIMRSLIEVLEEQRQKKLAAAGRSAAGDSGSGEQHDYSAFHRHARTCDRCHGTAEQWCDLGKKLYRSAPRVTRRPDIEVTGRTTPPTPE